MTHMQNFDGLKNMDEIFSSIDNQTLATITGGKKRKLTGIYKLSDIIGGVFNDVTGKMGY